MARKGSAFTHVTAGGVFLLLARLFVGGMFLYLAVAKLQDPFKFLKVIHLEYGIFPTYPPQLMNTVAAVLPWIEVVCAVALLLGFWLRGAALVITGMLLSFGPVLLYHAWQMYTAPGAQYQSFCDIAFDCGCGTGRVFICSKMAENIALQLAVLIPLFARSRFLCLAGLWKPAAKPAAVEVAAPAAAN